MMVGQLGSYMQKNEAGTSSHIIYNNKLKTNQKKYKTIRRKQSNKSL